MPRKCAGTIEGELCQFSKVGGPTQPKPGQIRCVWCCPEAMQQACGTEGGLLRLAQLLRGMPEASRNLALRRLPEDTHEEHFEAEFGAQFKGSYPMDTEESDFSMDIECYVGGLLADEALEADLGELIHADGLPQALHSEGGGEDAAGVRDDVAQADPPLDLGEELPEYDPEPLEALMPEGNREEDASSKASDEDLEESKPKKRPAAKSKVKSARPLVKKKPAARKPRPNELCPGDNGEPCVFSTTGTLVPARIQPQRGETHCMFCCRASLEKAMSSERPKVRPTYHKLHSVAKAKASSKMTMWLGQETAQDLQAKSMNSKKKTAPQPDWKQLLEARQLLRAPLEDDELQRYEKAVQQDRQRARRKVLCPEQKGEHGTHARWRRSGHGVGRLPTLLKTIAACPPQKTQPLVWWRLGAKKVLGPCARSVIRCSHKIWSPWTSSG